MAGEKGQEGLTTMLYVLQSRVSMLFHNAQQGLIMVNLPVVDGGQPWVSITLKDWTAIKDSYSPRNHSTSAVKTSHCSQAFRAVHLFIFAHSIRWLDPYPRWHSDFIGWLHHTRCKQRIWIQFSAVSSSGYPMTGTACGEGTGGSRRIRVVWVHVGQLLQSYHWARLSMGDTVWVHQRVPRRNSWLGGFSKLGAPKVNHYSQ